MSTPRPTNTRRPDFGSRIDAVQAAIAGMPTGDMDSERTLRTLARSIAEQAAAQGFPELRAAAEALASAPRASMVALGPAVIEGLRDAAGAQRPDSTVLIIGGDDSLIAGVQSRMAGLDGMIEHARTAADAHILLKERPVVSVVLHLMLPDMDGRTLLQRLRENPMTAAVPVLLLAERLDDSLHEERVLHSSVEHLTTPRDVDAITRWIMARLRRAPESAKAARRDHLTGHLNRAAFREAFEVAQKECAQSGEPLSMAVISVDNSREQLGQLEENQRETVLQNVGLILSRSMRTTDIVARWGLYEFAALFPGEDQAGGLRAVAKVVEKLRTQRVEGTGTPGLTLSVASGLTTIETDESLEDALARVDHLIYRATLKGGEPVLANGDTETAPRAPRVLLLVRDAVTTQVLQQLLEKDHLDVLAVDRWEPDMADDISKQRFNLVVIDESLPPTGGIEALQVLRSDTRNGRMPIILLVASNAEETVARALEHGANDYVVRPFSPFAFLSRVHRLLSRGNGSGLSGLSPTRILLVSDDPKPLVLMASALHQRGGFDVLLARGAKDGLERLQSEAPSAILVDLPMAPLGNKSFMQALAEKAGRMPVDVVVAEAPMPGGDPPPLHPLAIRGRLIKPITPLRVAPELEGVLGLEPSTQRLPTAAERLNNEIRRVMRAAP